MQDASQAALDFDAMQRLCREEEDKMNRVIHSENPIVSIHDQDAGDNVLKESMPNGAEMVIRNRVVGDPIMWGRAAGGC